MSIKRHKYRAVKTTVDGIEFPSKAEARRYSVLKQLQKYGQISELELQPQYPLLAVCGQSKVPLQVGVFKADFRYFDSNGRQIVEDVKGVRTAVYSLKKKIVEANYGIEIKEVK